MTPDPTLRRFALSDSLIQAEPAAAGPRILDLSARPRTGLRGPGVPGWCARHGIAFPDRINDLVSGGGRAVARLGQSEILILPDSDAAALPPLSTGVFDAYREEGWLWLRLAGGDRRACLARLCSADLRPAKTPPGSVLQTQIVALDAVLIFRCAAGTDVVEILTDSASSDYLHATLAERCPEWPLYRG